MALLGTLEDLDLPSILQLIQTQSKTGTLRIKNPDGEEAKVLFENGNIVGSEAPSKGGRFRVAEMLVKAELVREEAVDHQENQFGRSAREHHNAKDRQEGMQDYVCVLAQGRTPASCVRGIESSP